MERIIRLRNDCAIEIHVLLVDDGSSDGTVNVIRQYSEGYHWVHQVDHKVNRGLAQGMRTIFNYVNDCIDQFDYLVVMDADDTHDPSIIPSMLDKSIEETLDIVVASRFAPGGGEEGLTWFRRVLSRGAGLYCRMLFHIKGLRDYSCGYRLYSTRFLKLMNKAYGDKVIESEGFECMVEIVAKSKILGVRLGEVPFILHYGMKHGESKMRIGKTIAGYFSLGMKLAYGRHWKIIRYGFNSVVVALLDTAIVYLVFHFVWDDIVLANTIGVVSGFIFHYMLSITSVFGVKAGLKSFLVYGSTFICGLGLADYLIWLSFEKLNYGFLVSKGISIVIPFFIMYLIRKHIYVKFNEKS